MAEPAPNESQRIDKWLWCARFFKTRTLATKFCLTGKLRLNGDHTPKAHANVRAGDVLTFPLGPHVRVIRVAATATRRGPATEAQALYEDLDPPEQQTRAKAEKAADPTVPLPAAVREKGAGRPTKRERRAIDLLREDHDDRLREDD